MLNTQPQAGNSRWGTRVSCVRALVRGREGWIVRWVDYNQPVWRQQVFFERRSDADALLQTVRGTVRNRRQRSRPERT
jgi:hypothetical protein